MSTHEQHTYDESQELAPVVAAERAATCSLTLPATLDSLEHVGGIVRSELARRRCPRAIKNRIAIALEELFVNVCSYAYAGCNEPGSVRVDVTSDDEQPGSLAVRLTDWGSPFDPVSRRDLLKQDSPEKLKIGGLGIYMVKRFVDVLTYQRDGNANVVTFTMAW